MYKPKVKKLKTEHYKGRKILFIQETGRDDTGSYYKPSIESYVEVTARWEEEDLGLQTVKGETKQQVMDWVKEKINDFAVTYAKGPDWSGGHYPVYRRL